MDYYDIHSILIDEEKVNVKFKHTIYNFGFYIGPRISNIKKNKKVDLPYFLVGFLIQNEHCEITSRYTELKNDLAAEPSIVNLRDTHFFMIESRFFDPDILLSIFFERLGVYLKNVMKYEFCENDTQMLSYEERKYVITCRKWFKAFEDFYFHKNKDEIGILKK